MEVDWLRADGKPLAFTRSGARIELARPTAEVELSYHATVPLGPDGQDAKSRPYVEPERVRLSEVSLWYPVFYDGSNTFPWPPVPGVGRIRLPRLPGMHWATSGVRKDDGTFELVRPGDLVVVGVPFPERKVRVEVAGLSVTFVVLSPHADALIPQLTTLLERHLARLGPVGANSISVVEFPQTSRLSFVSSSLIVFNSKMLASLDDGKASDWSIVAHELAHLWFGVALRPDGEAAPWLTESFAEYYAWLATADRLGGDAYATLRTNARRVAGAGSVRLDSIVLGHPEYDLVYYRGSLAVEALAEIVGESHLNQAIREIQSHQRPWRVKTLFEALEISGANSDRLRQFRETWGL